MSQQEVRLKILSTDHTGPVSVCTLGPIGPKLTASLHEAAVARMAYYEGTLYTDLPPLCWTAIDGDRAAALGYGPREPWPEFPAPDPIKPGPVTQYLNPKVDSMIRMDPAQQLQALEEARQKKVLMLNAHIYPQSGAFILGRGVRIISKTSDGDASFILTWDTFDRLTVLQLQEHIKNRLK